VVVGGHNPERVTFTADGLTLVGNLAVAAPAAPAVVLTGPFTGVKEQVVGVYAERLRERGVTTLAFDHRGFGESGGRRAHEDSQGKLSDLRAALSVLGAHPAVDAARVGAAGSAWAAVTPSARRPPTPESAPW
jgi:fermentation-respiration switch protein FrsA (DUF1100 family)